MISGTDPFGVLPWSATEFTVAAATNVQAADIAVTSEATDLAAVIIPTEAIAGSESANLTTQIVASDAGTLSDAASATQTQTQNGADGGTGSDGTALSAQLRASDAIAGNESPSLAASAGASDSGTGSESPSITAIVVASDAGTLTEGAAATNVTPQQNSDSGTGSDGTALSAQLQASDSGTGADKADLAAVVVAKDAGTLSDAASATQTQSQSGTDGGTGSDGTALSAQLQASEAVAGAESPLIAANAGASDSGTGSDKADLAAVVVAKDGGTLAESAAATNVTPQQNTDGGTGSDGTAIAAQLQVSEPIGSADKLDLAVQVVAKDSGALSEAANATQSNSPSGTDGGIGSDGTAIAARIGVVEQVVPVDPVQLVVNVVVKDSATLADAAGYTRPIELSDPITATDRVVLPPITTNPSEAIGGADVPVVSVLIVVGDGMSMAEAVHMSTERATVRYTLCATHGLVTGLAASNQPLATLDTAHGQVGSMRTSSGEKDCE